MMNDIMSVDGYNIKCIKTFGDMSQSLMEHNIRELGYFSEDYVDRFLSSGDSTSTLVKVEKSDMHREEDLNVLRIKYMFPDSVTGKVGELTEILYTEKNIEEVSSNDLKSLVTALKRWKDISSSTEGYVRFVYFPKL